LWQSGKGKGRKKEEKKEQRRRKKEEKGSSGGFVCQSLNASSCIRLHLVHLILLVLCSSSGVAATYQVVSEVRWSRGVAAWSRVIAAVLNHTPDE